MDCVTLQVKWAKEVKRIVANEVVARAVDDFCLLCWIALESFPDEDPRALAEEYHKHPLKKRDVDIARAGPKAREDIAFRQQEVALGREIGMQMEAKVFFVRLLVFKKVFEVGPDAISKKTVEVYGFDGKMVTGVLFSPFNWPRDRKSPIPYVVVRIFSRQTRVFMDFVLPRDRVLRPKHASTRFDLACSNFIKTRPKELHDTELPNLETFKKVMRSVKTHKKDQANTYNDKQDAIQSGLAESVQHISAVSTLNDEDEGDESVLQTPRGKGKAGTSRGGGGGRGGQSRKRVLPSGSPEAPSASGRTISGKTARSKYCSSASTVASVNATTQEALTVAFDCEEAIDVLDNPAVVIRGYNPGRELRKVRLSLFNI